MAKKLKPPCCAYNLISLSYTTDDDGIHLRCSCGWESRGIHFLDIQDATRIARAHCKGDSEKITKIINNLNPY